MKTEVPSTLKESFELLLKMNWVDTDTRVIKTANGANLRLGVEFHNHGSLLVQVTLGLFLNDCRVWGWGSESAEQNDEIVKWFWHQWHVARQKKEDRDQAAVVALKKEIFG